MSIVQMCEWIGNTRSPITWASNAGVEWDTAATPRAAKIAGATSIAVWTLVVVVGRLTAYNWFPPLALGDSC